MKQHDLTLKPRHGEPLRAYEARPDLADAPGVVVVHEIFGVDRHIRSVVDRFAEAGFAAIAPDLIGVDITLPEDALMAAFGALRKLPPEQLAVRAKVEEVISDLPPDWRKQVLAALDVAFKPPGADVVSGIGAAVAHLRHHGSPRVAVLGFCMGGMLTWAYAFAGGDADAFVPFYGRLPSGPWDATKVAGPVQGHYGAEDHGIPVPPLLEVAEAVKAAGQDATIHVYEEAPHAFFNETRPSYRPGPAFLAWERTLAFLRKTLGT